MKCPPKETLIEYVAREIDTATAETIRDHVDSGCHACGDEIARFASLRSLTSASALQDPPAWVLRRAQTIPSEVRDGSIARLVGKIASLVFDTIRDPLPAGVRSATAAGRQLLFRVLEFDIDVRIDETGPRSSRIVGQVLPGPDRALDAVAGAEVALSTGGRVVALTTANEIGEFHFDALGRGDYTLSIDVPEEILVVEGISIHAD